MKNKRKGKKTAKLFCKGLYHFTLTSICKSCSYFKSLPSPNLVGVFCFVLAIKSSLLMSQKQKTIFVCYLTWFDFCPCCNPYFEELLPTKFIYSGPIICTSLRFFPPDPCSRLLVTFFHLGCYQGLHSMQGIWPHCLMLWLLLTFLSSDEA